MRVRRTQALKAFHGVKLILLVWKDESRYYGQIQTLNVQSAQNACEKDLKCETTAGSERNV